ncbi:unnamed protein product [Candidula unifasciata]|uniref:Uncharacterized protein n=1 Tax=Candidula unifasciata TaxID=100452 RepID=A0A8S3YP97_9EUPU|nr:unnamed protein product [Candidula unifasciata]
MNQNTLPPIKKSGAGKGINLVQKSRKLAYEEPAKEIQDASYKSKKRLRELKKMKQSQIKPVSIEAEIERDKHIRIIGQLKAAEARNRIRTMRLRYEANKAQEISHLIACQPVALKAIRLEALVPPYTEVKEKTELLDKFQRQRVEALLEDSLGLLTNRVV